MYRDGRAKTTRDRSVSPAPFASKSQPIGKIPQPSKPPSATTTTSTHKHSKVSKPPAKSKTKRTPEPSGTVSSNSTGNSGPTKPVQTGSKSVSKGKKSQKFHSNYPAPPSQPDVQSSSYLILPKNSSVPAHPTSNETNPFNQSVNYPTDMAKQILVESSGSSSGSASSSSSDSSDSESESESPLQASLPLIVNTTSGSGGGGVNVTAASMAGGASMNVPSLQTTQPNTRGI